MGNISFMQGMVYITQKRYKLNVATFFIFTAPYCLNTWVDPKTVFEPYPNPKKSPLEHQKVKNDPGISQNKMAESKEK